MLVCTVMTNELVIAFVNDSLIGKCDLFLAGWGGGRKAVMMLETENQY